MSTHTPGPLQVKNVAEKEPCGCVGLGHAIHFCPLHAKASELLKSLEELLGLVDGVSDWTPSSDVKIGRARALLREIEGKS